MTTEEFINEIKKMKNYVYDVNSEYYTIGSGCFRKSTKEEIDAFQEFFKKKQELIANKKYEEVFSLNQNILVFNSSDLKSIYLDLERIANAEGECITREHFKKQIEELIEMHGNHILSELKEQLDNMRRIYLF